MVPCFIRPPMVSGKSCIVLRMVMASEVWGVAPSLSYPAGDIQTPVTAWPIRSPF